METFTLLHVLLSLAAIASGFVVIAAFLKAKEIDGWTKTFLATAVLTTVTGFFFPFHGFTPAIGVGIVSMIILAVAIFARYFRVLTGVWRKTYVVAAVVALYLNVFVLVAQLFQKVPSLKALAPTQSEPPFAGAQLAVLALFIGLGIQAARKFRDEVARPAARSAGAGSR